MAWVVLRKQRQLIVTNWDRYTVTCGLFLLLSLLSWLLARSIPYSPTKPDLVQEKRWSAQCWLPAQFAPHHVQFAKNVCEKGLNQDLLAGVSSEGLSVGRVAVFSPEDENRRFPGFVSVSEALNKKPGTIRKTRNENDARKDGLRLQKLMGTKTPLLFFIVALLCIVPYILWTSAHACMPLNITATLLSTKELEFESCRRRQEVTQRLGRAIALAASGRHNAILFFCVKATSCVCAVIGIALTASTLASSVFGDADPRQKLKNSETEALEKVSQLLREPFGCFFQIALVFKGGHNIHDYTAQCMAERVQPSTLPVTSSQHKEADREILVQNLYFSLYIAMTCYLALFLLAELCSLAFWVWTLVVITDCPSSRFSSRNLSLDARLLLHLVTFEAGPLVCQDLERALLSEETERSGGEEGERMLAEGEEGAGSSKERVEETACKEVPE